MAAKKISMKTPALKLSQPKSDTSKKRIKVALIKNIVKSDKSTRIVNNNDKVLTKSNKENVNEKKTIVGKNSKPVIVKKVIPIDKNSKELLKESSLKKINNSDSLDSIYDQKKKKQPVIIHTIVPKKKTGNINLNKSKKEIKETTKKNSNNTNLLKAAKEALLKVPREMFTVATATDSNEPFSKIELEKFKKIVTSMKDDAKEELEMLEQQLIMMADGEGMDESSYSTHLTEQASDAVEREKAYLQSQRTSDYINKLDDAIVRIDHGTFGICRMCGLKLDSKRMMAVPVTQVCTTFKNTSKPCYPGKIFTEILNPIVYEEYVSSDVPEDEDEDDS